MQRIMMTQSRQKSVRRFTSNKHKERLVGKARQFNKNSILIKIDALLIPYPLEQDVPIFIRRERLAR